MKTIEIEITKEQVNDLLECDAVNLGGKIFIKKEVVTEAMAEYAKKKVNEVKTSQNKALNLDVVGNNEVAVCECQDSEYYANEEKDWWYCKECNLPKQTDC